ncbi:unnamed protein product [Acanthocheilonema viteae]|uniref:Uncharacterized protein n=1 Tax=Acanthocheilonema viteae TaxID=6277 RepID=A0A498S5M8_ACAVI|nr:unnamed protein product [Acanthocheilonema viteae]
MSIATISTNKLPFAIQTILGNDDKQGKISEWEQPVCERNDSVKAQKTNQRNSPTVPQRIGHSCQSLPRHKKPRTSFTKKQLSFIMLSFRFMRKTSPYGTEMTVSEQYQCKIMHSQKLVKDLLVIF